MYIEHIETICLLRLVWALPFQQGIHCILFINARSTFFGSKEGWTTTFGWFDIYFEWMPELRVLLGSMSGEIFWHNQFIS